MVKVGDAVDSIVPYGRLDESEATADPGHDRRCDGGQHTVTSNSVTNGHPNGEMGRDEPHIEEEQLFSSYREPGKSSDSHDSPIAEEGTESAQPQPELPKQPAVRMLSKKLIALNGIVSLLMFAVAGFITYHCFNKAMVLFSWHPTFMSIGYLILMSQAVLTLSGANPITNQRQLSTRVFLHWLLQAVAGILITIAAVCIFLNKIRLGKAHFQTTHAIFGLVTVICTLTSIVGGLFTRYSFQLRQYVRPIYAKIGHGIFGTVTYVLGSITLALGVYSHWFQEDNDANVRLGLLVAIIVVTLYVIVAPLASTIARVKTAIRTTL